MRGNYFDRAAPAVQRNMVIDVQTMASHDCGVELTEDQAEQVARALLVGARDGGALYAVPISRLRRVCAHALVGAE